MYLVVSQNGNLFQTLPIQDGLLAIGADVQGGLNLKHQAISPKQVELLVEGKRVTVSSVAGTPGFQFEGERRLRLELDEGLGVQVGPFELRLALAMPEGEAKKVGGTNGATVEPDWDEDLFGEMLGNLFEDEDATLDGRHPDASLIETQTIISEDGKLNSVEIGPVSISDLPDPTPTSEEDKTAVSVGPTVSVAGGTPLILKDGTTFIGSGSGMDIMIAAPSILRRHAVLIFRGGKVKLKNMDEAGSVHVNGSAVQGGVLCHGDTVEIGGKELTFHWNDQPESAMEQDSPHTSKNVAEESQHTSGGQGRIKWLGAALVLGALGIGAAIVWQDGKFGGENSQVQPQVDEAQVRVARALLDGNCLDGALDVIGGMPSESPMALTLRGRAMEAKAANELEFALWLETVSQAQSREDWSRIRSGEGAALLARAQGGFTRGDPPELVQFWIQQGRYAYQDAKRLRPKSEKIEAGLESSRRLEGRLEVQGDELEELLGRESVSLLLERGKGNLAAGQPMEATRTLRVVVARKDEFGNDVKRREEAQVLLREAVSQLGAQTLPLFNAAKTANQGGQPLNSRALLQGVLRLNHGDVEAIKGLEALKGPLHQDAEKRYAEAEDDLANKKTQAAQDKLRQVLRYVPDRTDPIHRNALKKLEAMAGPS